MISLPSEPGAGDRILTWAREAQRTFREIDRRFSAILPPRPRRRVDPAPGEVRPLELSVVWVDEEPKVRVRASTVAGGSSADLGFAAGDAPPYLLTPAAGVVQAGITIDADGQVTSRWIEIVPELSDDEDDTFHVEIGTVVADGESWRANNSRYGPITANICRRWYATAAPFFTVTWDSP